MNDTPQPAPPQEVTREIGIVLARRALDNPWIDHIWSTHGVLYPAPETDQGTVLSDEGSVRLVYAGVATVEIFASDTAHYRDNLIEGAPRLWVSARTCEGKIPEFLRATADPTEGEAYSSSGSDIVGTLPMPDDIASWIAKFVDEFHVERVFLKRKRDRSERAERGHGPKPEGDR